EIVDGTLPSRMPAATTCMLQPSGSAYTSRRFVTPHGVQPVVRSVSHELMGNRTVAAVVAAFERAVRMSFSTKGWKDGRMANAVAVPTSVRLREQNEEEWTRALEHPLIKDTAAGTVDDAVFERWVVINTQFLRTYRRFFIVMGTLAPDTRSSPPMVPGRQRPHRQIQAGAADAGRPRR